MVELLHAERVRRKLSKYALAQKSGLAQQTIGYLERGKRRPAFDTILQFAAGLDLDLAEVITKARQQLSKKK